MFPIVDLISQADANYLNYLRKKTGYILSKNDPNQVRWLWLHLLKESKLHELPQSLNPSEQEVLDLLLLNFGYLKQKLVDKKVNLVEKNNLWLFKHPGGGMFIPLEIIKSLLVNPVYLNKNYLFTLYYRIRRKEQKNYFSLFGDEAKIQYNFKDEKSLLDSTLVLYIRLSSYHLANALDQSIISKKGRILHSPFSIIDKTSSKEEQKYYDLEEFFPSKPVNLWQHLEKFFPSMKQETQDWYNLIKDGRKSFYRSLGLMSPVKVAPLIYLFRFAYFVPVFNSDFHNNLNPNNICVVTPQEIKSIINLQT